MNTKLNILRTILILLLFMMFGVIFNFSNQNGEKSGNLSRSITEEVVQKIKSIQELEGNEREKAVKKVEYIVRKLAHLSLYFIVGILTASLINTYKLKKINQIMISFGIGAFYAATDEFHQLFIPDRSASIIDVGIDSCGVIVGILLIEMAIIIYKKVAGNNQNCSNHIQKQEI